MMLKRAVNSTYYSMSYIEGRLTRSDHKERAATLNPQVMARLGVLVGFRPPARARSRRVIHRDIKPENILINKKRQPIVLDFGIAKAQTSAKLSQTGMFIGTPLYMSPEQIRGIRCGWPLRYLQPGLRSLRTGDRSMLLFTVWIKTALLYKQVT